MCALQASLAQLAARRPAAPPDAAATDDGGDALAAKYRRVKAAARAATARVAQLQGAWFQHQHCVQALHRASPEVASCAPARR